MPRLENWSIVFDSCTEDMYYKAPELIKKRLQGDIYDDENKRFENGEFVVTSSIQELNIKENYAQTKNTKYILGKPSEDYLKWLKSENLNLSDFESK